METEYSYTCPNCSKECSVPESMTGQNLICPHCSQEFFATAPEQASTAAAPPAETRTHSALPEKLPFFKSGRRKILEARLAELVADGELDKSDERDLTYLAAQLGLDLSDLSDLRKEKLLKEFDPIKRHIESTLMLTDDDLETMQRLERKYDIKLTLGGFNQIYRSIYLMETQGELPAPIQTDLMLKSKELAYHSIQTTWHQTRVKNHGYSGTSVSIPSGIKGVRFRFGGYTPIRSEEMTPLASGTLYVTSERLLFNGDARNTTIALNKIVDCHVFSDSLKIEKSTGMPDLFSMNAAQARYILALVGALKQL
jgi:DNA-directed RNA polymerase subunit RPC12/RpoP